MVTYQEFLLLTGFGGCARLGSCGDHGASDPSQLARAVFIGGERFSCTGHQPVSAGACSANGCSWLGRGTLTVSAWPPPATRALFDQLALHHVPAPHCISTLRRLYPSTAGATKDAYARAQPDFVSTLGCAASSVLSVPRTVETTPLSSSQQCVICSDSLRYSPARASCVSRSASTYRQLLRKTRGVAHAAIASKTSLVGSSVPTAPARPAAELVRRAYRVPFRRMAATGNSSLPLSLRRAGNVLAGSTGHRIGHCTRCDACPRCVSRSRCGQRRRPRARPGKSCPGGHSVVISAWLRELDTAARMQQDAGPCRSASANRV